MEELYHFGILGMKWGIRRFQNEDGTRTPAGLKRYSESNKKNETEVYDNPVRKIKKVRLSQVSDEDLRKAINRLRMEKEYKTLLAEMYPKKKSFVSRLLSSYGDTLIREIPAKMTAYNLEKHYSKKKIKDAENEKRRKDRNSYELLNSGNYDNMTDSQVKSIVDRINNQKTISDYLNSQS